MGCSSSRSSGIRSNDFHNRYLLGKKISSFGYGEVYTTTVVQKGKQCLNNKYTSARSVKIVDLQLGRQVAKMAAREVNLWKMVGQHKNISQLHEVIYADAFGHHLCYMVMDSCRCTFLDYLDKASTLNERVLGECFASMLKALEFMHTNYLVHRDVKPEAFRVAGDDPRTIKLGDFGNAIVLKSGKAKGECGTSLYMAPEMITGEEYDGKVDVWSLGVLVYILFFGGKAPFTPKDRNHGSDIKLAIASYKATPSFASPVSLSSTAISFAMSLLDRNPLYRPSARHALKKSYMVSVMEDKHEIDADLPCLRLCLIYAKQTKVFDARKKEYGMSIEELLNKKQLESFGIPIPTHTSSFLGLLGSEDSQKGATKTARRQRHWLSDSTGTSSTETTVSKLQHGHGIDLASISIAWSTMSEREDPWLCECDV
mmetsp:Transcript_56184/g.89030  ORF Transcript_56184/g.89030 Transcript_56184/m.89030 type:complete len:427 (+) Transcript_56184:14-1294(+)